MQKFVNAENGANTYPTGTMRLWFSQRGFCSRKRQKKAFTARVNDSPRGRVECERKTSAEQAQQQCPSR